MAPPQRKRQNAEARIPAILKAFYTVIDTEGIENASVAKVAEKAGVHPSLIIHYFGTKENMVIALVDEVLNTYSKLFQELPTGGSPETRLDRMLKLVWSRKWHEAASFTVVFSFLAMSHRHEPVMERVRNLYSLYRSYLANQIAEMSEAGVIQVANPEATVEALISLTEGSHYFCRFHLSPDGFDRHCTRMIQVTRQLLGAQTS